MVRKARYHRRWDFQGLMHPTGIVARCAVDQSYQHEDAEIPVGFLEEFRGAFRQLVNLVNSGAPSERFFSFSILFLTITALGRCFCMSMAGSPRQ
jgi:hypothetical protein